MIMRPCKILIVTERTQRGDLKLIVADSTLHENSLPHDPRRQWGSLPKELRTNLGGNKRAAIGLRGGTAKTKPPTGVAVGSVFKI